MTKKKFDINKYKTHDGERGDADQWQASARIALMQQYPEATADEIEDKMEKLTKIGKRQLRF